jgi:death on curing protein
MTEPIWIEIEETLAFHERQIAEHGGSAGIRDRGLLESALGKPKNIFAYAVEEASLPRLAASYAFGIATNHPFVDGNKRTALVVSLTFLDLNGIALTATLEGRYEAFLALAAGEIDERQLTDWFVANCAAKHS